MGAPGGPPFPGPFDPNAPHEYTGPPPTGLYRYPPAAPPWQYPLSPYGQPPYAPARDPADIRPGVITAAAVVGWVLAGLLLLAAGLLFFGAAFLHDFDAVNGTSTGSYVAEFTVDALLDVATAGLLIAGGIGLTNGSSAGRVVQTLGGALVFVAAAYWLVRWGDRSGGTIVGYAVIFGVSAALIVALSWTSAAGGWLRQRAGSARQ